MMKPSLKMIEFFNYRLHFINNSRHKWIKQNIPEFINNIQKLKYNDYYNINYKSQNKEPKNTTYLNIPKIKN